MENDYLSNPLIEDVVYEISDTQVSIQSPCTGYVSYKLPCRLDKEALLRRYRNVLAMAKAQGVKISYTLHIRRTIQELWPEYEAACSEREELFPRLKELALKVKARGIHYGAVDDEVLAAAKKIAWQLAAYEHGGKPARSIAEVSYDLSRLERQLARGLDSDCMISL